jgi:hypothetical protein
MPFRQRNIANKVMEKTTPSVNGTRSRGTVLASLGALGSAILASSCCLPMLPFLAALGTAGTSAFFVKMRPFLVAASLGFIAFGFYEGWHAKRCGRKRSVSSSVLLWISAFLVLVFTLFPQAMANFIANVATR